MFFGCIIDPMPQAVITRLTIYQVSELLYNAQRDLEMNFGIRMDSWDDMRSYDRSMWICNVVDAFVTLDHGKDHRIGPEPKDHLFFGMVQSLWNAGVRFND